MQFSVPSPVALRDHCGDAIVQMMWLSSRITRIAHLSNHRLLSHNCTPLWQDALESPSLQRYQYPCGYGHPMDARTTADENFPWSLLQLDSESLSAAALLQQPHPPISKIFFSSSYTFISTLSSHVICLRFSQAKIHNILSFLQPKPLHCTKWWCGCDLILYMYFICRKTY